MLSRYEPGACDCPVCRVPAARGAAVPVREWGARVITARFRIPWLEVVGLLIGFTLYGALLFAGVRLWFG
jgi:hypothetical protein